MTTARPVTELMKKTEEAPSRGRGEKRSLRKGREPDKGPVYGPGADRPRADLSPKAHPPAGRPGRRRLIRCLPAAALLMLTGCLSLPLVPGRIESLERSGGWEERHYESPVVCGELSLGADFPSEDSEELGRIYLEHLCAIHNLKSPKEGTPLLLDAEIREQGFMKNLRMRRSLSLVMTVRNREGESLSRYICGIEGSRTIESTPWHYKLLKRGFGKLFP